MQILRIQTMLCVIVFNFIYILMCYKKEPKQVMSFNANSNIATILKQLSTIGVPLGIVNRLILQGYDALNHEGRQFARFKWTEKGTPVFKFNHSFEIYNSFNELKQTNYVVLMGLNHKGEYIEDGIYEDLKSLSFKENIAKYSRSYLADFDGKPLREQNLIPTSMEEKVARLKNTLSR